MVATRENMRDTKAITDTTATRLPAAALPILLPAARKILRPTQAVPLLLPPSHFLQTQAFPFRLLP